MKPNPNAPRTDEQNRVFHKLIGQHKFDPDEKAELVFLVSGERTRSSAKLTFAEMATAIKRLQGPIDSSVKKMRAKIYELYREIAGLPPNTQYAFQQADYDAVNVFLVKKFGKPLHNLPHKVLPDAVTAVEAWRNYELGKAIKRGLTAPRA